MVLSTGSGQINHEIELVCSQCSFVPLRISVVSFPTTFCFTEYPNDHYLLQMLMKNFEKYKSGVCKEELHYGIVLWVPISLKFCQHILIKDIYQNVMIYACSCYLLAVNNETI